MLVFFLAGLVFFLYGRQIFEKSLEETNQFRLQCLVRLVARYRYTALVLGSLFGIGTQSSTVAVMTLVSLVHAGILRLTQAVGMVLGASIGTTLLLQLLTFDLANYGLWLVVAGFLISRLPRVNRSSGGRLVIGLGLMFYGISLMGKGFAVLQQTAPGEIILTGISTNIFLTLTISFLVTVICQSSLAPLAVSIALIRDGNLSIMAALPVILGSHIGAGILPLLAVPRTGTVAVTRQLALANFIYRLLGSLIFLLILSPWAKLTLGLTDFLVPGPVSASRYLANAHTLFTLITVGLFLAGLKPFTRVIEKLFPGRKEIDNILIFLRPGLAAGPELEQAARQESRLLADKVSQLLKETEGLWEGDASVLLGQTRISCQSILAHQEAIVDYFTKIPEDKIAGEYPAREMKIIEINVNLREIAEVINNNLIDVLRKKMRKGLSFSLEGLQEILAIHHALTAEAGLLAAVLENSQDSRPPAQLAEEINPILERSYQVHIKRRRRGIWEAEETSTLHFTALMVLEHIHYHLQKALTRIIHSQGE